MHDNLIILAGGASSRMKNSKADPSLSPELLVQSNNRSKGLIGIDNEGRPMLDYLLFNSKKAGYKDIYFVIGKSGEELFQELYGNQFNGLKISYAIQHIPKEREKPLGTADAVFQTMEQYPELKSEIFTVCNSDNLYSIRALTILRETEEKNALLGYDRETLNYSIERISRFAVLKIDTENYLIDIVEKPHPDDVNKYIDMAGKLRVSMNIFKFNGNDLFEYFKNCQIHPIRKEKEIPTVLKNFIDTEDGKIAVIPFSEHVPDLTSKEDILKMKNFVNQNYGQLNWEM